jgi:hypothetical protein
MYVSLHGESSYVKSLATSRKIRKQVLGNCCPLFKLSFFDIILGYHILLFQRRGNNLLESWSLLILLRLKNCLVRC